MDRPTLHPLAAELADGERLAAFADGCRERAARVSEPALPLLLAALHEALERALLVVLLPDDADARDAAEAAAWFLGEEQVALFPSRGVRWDSGLEPPPHLVGERARALDVLAGGGLVCASAAALAERMPPPEARPAPLDLAAGDEPGIDGLAEQLALAGYERVERVEERGQFAVRGGIVDVFPTTGREPLRIELFGDEIEAIRAFSPFTQRALRPVERRDGLPRGRAARSTSSSRACPTTRTSRVPRTTSCRRSTARPTSSGSPTRCARSGTRSSSTRSPLDGAAQLDPFPRGQPFAFEAQRPAVAARGLAEAENELASFVRAGQRVVVAFPHRGEALRTANLLRRVEAELAGGGRRAPRRARGSPSRSRRPGAGSSGATSGSRCCPTRRSSASGRRAATPGSAARSSRSPTCAPATTSSTRTTASGSCSASRRRRSRASRATTCCSPSAARTASTSRTSRSARSRATSAPTRRRRRSRSSAARRGSAQEPRARVGPGARRRAARRSTRAARRAGRRLRPRASGSSGSRPSSRTARPRTSSARSRR